MPEGGEGIGGRAAHGRAKGGRGSSIGSTPRAPRRHQGVGVRGCSGGPARGVAGGHTLGGAGSLGAGSPGQLLSRPGPEGWAEGERWRAAPRLSCGRAAAHLVRPVAVLPVVVEQQRGVAPAKVGREGAAPAGDRAAGPKGKAGDVEVQQGTVRSGRRGSVSQVPLRIDRLEAQTSKEGPAPGPRLPNPTSPGAVLQPGWLAGCPAGWPISFQGSSAALPMGRKA